MLTLLFRAWENQIALREAQQRADENEAALQEKQIALQEKEAALEENVQQMAQARETIAALQAQLANRDKY
jgi:hypothetical protein